MFCKEYDSFMVGVQHALTLPIRARCAELNVLLERGSLLELHSFFPVLIDNIFGPQGTICWGLRIITESQTDEFRQLHHFLSPCGPFFRLIYNLLQDPNIKYDFPLAYLPTKIRHFLENTMGHPFYSELVHVNNQTKQVTSLLLNPFDYYFFHFAYHLINPWQQRVGSSVMSWNTVYYSLCCNYILHFLPADPNAVITPSIYYNGKNPNKTMTASMPAPQILSSPTKSSALVSPIVLNKGTDDAFIKNLDRHHPRNEIWRSETVLTVLTDMWLHNDQVNQPLNCSNLNITFNKSQPMRPLHYNELPTGEYMRIVRVLIKQLHSFSASAKADDTHLSELKKIAIPMIQGKFYIFLRNLIHRWPLDGSFRLVLELWLTYIQPWRYQPTLIKQLNKKDVDPDVEDVAIAPQQQTVDKEYLPFIAENLLCYTVIFQQLLPRFGRVDLVSPKMSLMLYRLTKVFDQPNLPEYLREVEQCVDNNRPSPSHHHKYDWSNNLPPLSPTCNWSTNVLHTSFGRSDPTAVDSSGVNLSQLNSHSAFLGSSLMYADRKWSAIVKQKIFELEGPNFCYKPLFSNAVAPEVFELICLIKKSIRHAQELIAMKEAEEKVLYSGFWGSIKYFFHANVSSDEFSLNDRKKVPIYLEVSYNNLKDMFGITEEVAEVDTDNNVTQANGSFEFSNDFAFLTPEKVRNRAKFIKYEGDPDLQPIRSDECAFLVRTLYQLAQKVNENFGPTFYQLYHNPSYWGRLARRLLCPPITVYRYEKSIPGSPRVSNTLPPRVSFRFLASYRLLGYLFVGAVISKCFGYRVETFLLFVLLIFMLYKMLRAIKNDSNEMSVRHNYPTQGFGNISFNDSFQ